MDGLPSRRSGKEGTCSTVSNTVHDILEKLQRESTVASQQSCVTRGQSDRSDMRKGCSLGRVEVFGYGL